MNSSARALYPAATTPADSRERFLLEIGARVPADRVTAIHLFPAIRQGGVETGAAVVAVAPYLEREVMPDVSDGEEHPPEPVLVPTDKHTVYTATYRLVLKGADRGKWESSVVAEAEAPLHMVDTVVQGVQRRLGDDGEPERLEGAELAGALKSPAPAPAANP